MGIRMFSRCSTNYTDSPSAVAPNPDPKKWRIISVEVFTNAYILLAEYFGCTNYEGKKLMVFRGRFTGTADIKELDPHFRPGPWSPVARLRPDDEGHELAREIARML